MNPELRRNLWLECTPSRLALMTGVVALVTFATWMVREPGEPAAFGVAGVIGFAFLVVAWGARNAARSVLGEVRERTWDFQRLSAIRPWSMTLGKLAGSTSYVWYGGLLALAVAVTGWSREHGGAVAVKGALLAISAGVLAQAVAMGSALSAARRRRADARVAIVPHQAAGIAAALGGWWLLGVFGFTAALETVARNFDADAASPASRARWDVWFADELTFFIASYAAFAAFAIAGAWRVMRLELMASNAPVVWPVFLAFLALYASGFAESLGGGLSAAYVAVHVATLVAVLVEPKDLVEWRVVGGAWARGALGEAVGRAPAFAWGLLAAGALAAAGIAAGPDVMGDEGFGSVAVFAALLGFLARDIGLFVFFNARAEQRRGDFAALVSLALLYVVGGTVSNALDAPLLQHAFIPGGEGTWPMAVGPWAQAIVIAVFAALRLRASGRAVAPA
ncbi:MAG: hypothetical protein MI723_14930 [Caulobacterales bacterium]|nr:hypothetical protein [Caulobacterales bacterium]